MLKALFYKEWIKTRRVIYLLALLSIALIAYTFIHNEQMIRVGGALQTWANIVLKAMPILPQVVDWFPLLAGTLLALVQFVPEMTDKRLKLTLHLPLPEGQIVRSMMLYGSLILTLMFLFFYAALAIGLQRYYATEIIAAMSYQLIPCLLAGLTAYFFASWICLEPNWRQRVMSAICAIGGLAIYYFNAKPGAYLPLLPWLIVLTLVAFYFPFYSTARFKEGVQ